MTRLPIPGSDDGTWGDILNTFLSQVHAADGSLKPQIIGTSQLAPNAVTNAQLDSTTQSTLSQVASKYTKPGAGIPATDLTTSTQANLTKAATSVQTVNTKTPDGTGAINLAPSDIGAVASSSVGIASGVAPLDTSALVPVANLPVSNTALTLVGAGMPSSGLGINGDYYIDNTTGNLWGPKASGAWPGSPVLQYGNFGAYGTVGTNFISGRWYPASQGTGTALLITQNNMIALPFGVSKAHTFAAAGLNVTVAGTGGTLRFGIYTDNGSGYPASLVQDFGTVAATTTGAVQITQSVSLQPGLYWIVVVGQGGTVQPTVTTWNPALVYPWFGSSGPGVAAGNEGYGGTSASGALPSTYPNGAGLLGANSVPYVQLEA